MDEVKITLPYPPTGNLMWRHTRGGKHYLTDHARDYYKYVELIARTQGKILNLNVPLTVHCVLNPPDRRRRDLDNAWKVIGDSLTKANLWQDDKYIRKLTLEWGEVVEKGSVSVSVVINVEKALTCS